MIGMSLQTQTLFTVAQDLKEMEIKISVDEADIGKIREGQKVTYTVDAYPGREFMAAVTQIRQDPREKQNVVTYVVIASAPNPAKMLLPGMTANVRITIDSRQDVQKVPLAALRFTPAGVGPRPSAVWVLGEDRMPLPVPIEVGLSDGKMAEISSGRPIERVIIGVDHSVPPTSVAKRLFGGA